MSCVVELRGAATDLLHPVMREGLATLRGALSAVGRSLPRHALKELEGFRVEVPPDFDTAELRRLVGALC